MTIQSTLTRTAVKAQTAVTGATDVWARGVRRAIGFGLSDDQRNRLDPTAPVDWYYDTATKLLDQQRRYVKTVTGAVLSVGNVAREQTVSVVNTMRDQVSSASDVARQQADQAEQIAEEQANAAELEARREARQARREARAAATEKFANMTKPELQDQLERRDLPKTGTVDELRERLIDSELDANSN